MKLLTVLFNIAGMVIYRLTFHIKFVILHVYLHISLVAITANMYVSWTTSCMYVQFHFIILILLLSVCVFTHIHSRIVHSTQPVSSHSPSIMLNQSTLRSPHQASSQHLVQLLDINIRICYCVCFVFWQVSLVPILLAHIILTITICLFPTHLERRGLM